MTSYIEHSRCPKLCEMNDFVIPYDVEIPPFPVNLKEQCEQVSINIFGLPDGLSYDNLNRVVYGKPLSIGHHGVVIVAMNNFGINCIGFNIKVIDYERTPIHITTPQNQTIQLGQPIQTTKIDIDDKSANVEFIGLPEGVIYDTFYEHIYGTPNLPGEHRVSIIVTDKYGTQVMTKFVINVEGIMNPAIDLNVTTEEIVNDKINNFHSLDDQILYTFTVKNKGNIPLINVCLEDNKLGQFKSNTKILPNEQSVFKYTYCLTQDDLDKGQINTHTIASGETNNSIKITTLTTQSTIILRGHDRALYIKTVATDFIPKLNVVKCLYMVTNCSEDTINQIKMSDSTGATITLDSDILLPNDNIFGQISYKTKPMQGNTIEKNLIIVGQTPDNKVVGNTYKSTVSINKTNISVQLYTTRCVISESQTITLAAQLHVNRIDETKNYPKPSGIMKFFDGIKYIGKSNIHNDISVLKLSDLPGGKHQIYAIYQGDQNYEGNGSFILNVLVGNEKTFTDNQNTYIKDHIDKFKKIELKAHNIIKNL